MTITEKKKIEELVKRNAIFYVSHSGGKDSQAMYALITKIVPHEQIVVVHSDLGEIEWEGIQDHINNTINHELNVVRANKTFFEMVLHRAKTRPDVPSWPSSSTRQCTSDLKRNPIYKFIRNDMKEKNQLIALNCTGLRSEESSSRSKKKPLVINKTLSKAGREVYDYLPIQELSTEQVFQVIKEAQQKPFWAYKRNKRLSCVFCIMGCENDLKHGAEQRPKLLEKYIKIEQETGYTMFHNSSLAEKVA